MFVVVACQQNPCHLHQYGDQTLTGSQRKTGSVSEWIWLPKLLVYHDSEVMGCVYRLVFRQAGVTLTDALTISCHLTQMSKHSKAGRGNYTLRRTTKTFHGHCQQNIPEPFDQSKILVYQTVRQRVGHTV